MRLILLAVVFMVVAGQGCVGEPAPQDPGTNRDRTSASYVGRQACVGCHRQQFDLWTGSHHDLAMEVADATTVLGDFDHTSFTHFGVTSTFFKRDGNFLVQTDGPDGELHEYEIEYTFGVVPLQQYLIGFPDGRYQVLGIAWDTRPAKEGGQRWFHLYPGDPVPYDDLLHWTGIAQNWNFMCAECHSTNLQKNYDLHADSYATTWSEIDVSCETCHGPASNHVTWAKAVADGGEPEQSPQKGLLVDLGKDRAEWNMDPVTGLARRDPPRPSGIVMDTCARCHMRRSVIHAKYIHGSPIMDTYRPALLDETLYHADGQILEEVYVYGSFIQSAMYSEGVTCTDCHDPHDVQLRDSADGVCARCHLPEKYATPAHHHHDPDSPGASCVECHMPARNYMVVDPRRDHSFRIPRPDLSVKIGTPNACNGCHDDHTAQWASEAVEVWFESPRRPGHYGEAIHAGREGLVDAEAALAGLINDPAVPAIARATAVSLIDRYLSPASLPALRRALQDSDPLVRAGAAGSSQVLDANALLTLVLPLLNDPIRAVRLAAARVLATLPPEQMTQDQRAAIQAGLDAYRISELVNADRPEAHLNLGWLHAQSGDLDLAEQSYKRALAQAPAFPPSYVNLADLYRLQNRDDEGEKVLREALAVDPAAGDIHFALGLLLVRRGQSAEALHHLGRAAELNPRNVRFHYVLGVALHSSGETGRALEVLRRAHLEHPGNRELLLGLATISRDSGDLESAMGYARKLVELSPRDQGARQLLQGLQVRQ